MRFDEGHDVETTFVVDAGADPGLIQFKYLGANSIKLTSDGHIEVLSAANPLDMTAPVAHQGMGKNSLEIPIRFSLNGTVVTFDFPDGYDPESPRFSGQ